MNYEQRYKKAIEKIRKGLQPLSDGAKISGVTRAFLEEVFPELGESEDERIRGAIIDHLKDYNLTEWAAWLEKQGQEPKKVSIWKHWKNGIAGNGEDKPIYLIKTGYTYNLSSCLSFECDYIELSDLDNLLLEKQGEKSLTVDIKSMVKSYKQRVLEQSNNMESPLVNMCVESFKHGIENTLDELNLKNLEKQGEQKVPSVEFKAKDWYVSNVDGKIHDMTYNPTDKVEPKFHEGDWIVNDYCSGKVIALTDDAYLLDSGQGIPFSCEHNAHLWTIQDAKDGDVLTNGEIILIFKQFEEPAYREHIIAYIGLDINGNIQVTDDTWTLGIDKAKPATKEQRTLLFQRIEEAGYQWDAKKKELKLLISNGGDFESNNSKQTPTWSEEDEKMVEEILDAIEEVEYEMALNMSDVRQWLKNLKQRLS